MKAKLVDIKGRLAIAKDLVAGADNLSSTTGAVYLSNRDEIRFLLDEMAVLKSVVGSSESRATRLIAPIYASDTPITPKQRVALTGGLFSGLFLGLLLALAHRVWIKLKVNTKELGHSA